MVKNPIEQEDAGVEKGRGQGPATSVMEKARWKERPTGRGWDSMTSPMGNFTRSGKERKSYREKCPVTE